MRVARSELPDRHRDRRDAVEAVGFPGSQATLVVGALVLRLAPWRFEQIGQLQSDARIAIRSGRANRWAINR